MQVRKTTTAMKLKSEALEEQLKQAKQQLEAERKEAESKIAHATLVIGAKEDVEAHKRMLKEDLDRTAAEVVSLRESVMELAGLKEAHGKLKAEFEQKASDLQEVEKELRALRSLNK